MLDYEKLLFEFGTDYAKVREGYAEENSLRAFFGGDYGRKTFDNPQALDEQSLRGRLLSSSYIPLAEDARHALMLDALKKIFDAHNQNGFVVFDHTTEIFYGQLLSKDCS